MGSPPSKILIDRSVPLKIGLIYAFTGSLWILSSDTFLLLFVTDPSALIRLQTFKGWLFVGVTACLLYILIRRYMESIWTSQRSLMESEERFRLLVENVTDYEIFMLDPEGRIISWNIGAERIKGYKAEEIIGSPHSVFFTREDLGKGIPEAELAKAAGEGRFEDEGWRVRKDGSLFWANVITTALRDKDGRLHGYSKVIRDITDRKLARDRLLESEERYRIIAETASDVIITIDEKSAIVFVNPAVEKIFGYGPAELYGKQLTMLMPERYRNAHLSAVSRYLESGERKIGWGGIGLYGLHRNGYEIPLEVSYGEFVRDGKHFFTGIVRDITERKNAEREKEYKDMLERFNQELETLVTERTTSLMALTLADKIRTPAAVIGGLARRTVEKTEVPGKAKENLEVIISESDKLEATVKEFHSFLKSRPSMFTYEDLNEIVKDMFSIYEKEAAKKGVELVMEVPDQPLKMNMEKNQLRTVIFNLLRNAIESTPQGGRVTVATSSEGKHIRLEVSDTGHGIPPENLDRIFDPFFSTKTYRFGMGLPLIKQIVSEHMGEIAVESEVEKGTTFIIIFPVRWKETTRQAQE